MLPDRTKVEKLHKRYFPSQRVWDLSTEALLHNLRSIDLEITPQGDLKQPDRVTSAQTPKIVLKRWLTESDDLNRIILSYIDDPQTLLAAIMVNKYTSKITESSWFWLQALRNRYGGFKTSEDPKKVWIRVELSPVPFWQIVYERKELEHRSTIIRQAPNQEGIRTDLARIILLKGKVSEEIFQETLLYTKSPHQTLSAFFLGLKIKASPDNLLLILKRTLGLSKGAYHDLHDFMEETEYYEDFLVESLFGVSLSWAPPEVLDYLLSLREDSFTEEDLERILIDNPYEESFTYAFKFFPTSRTFPIFWSLTSRDLRNNYRAVLTLLRALDETYKGRLFSDDHRTFLGRIMRYTGVFGFDIALNVMGYPSEILVRAMII